MTSRPWVKPPEVQVVRFEIPAGLWMTANRDYGHGGWKKTIVNQLHEIAGWSAIDQNLQHFPDPCQIAWIITYPKGTGRKADPDNSYPTVKAILDGLVKLGYIADDNADHIVSRTYRRSAQNHNEQGMHTITLTIERPS